MTAKKQDLICITKKTKEDKQYIICFKDKKKSAPKKTSKNPKKKSKKRTMKSKIHQKK